MSDIQDHQALSPFDDANADLILLTADSVTFRVFKVILSQASPVFASALAIPLASPESGQQDSNMDGILVFGVAEDSRTIDMFLRCCYPLLNPALDVSNVCAVYKAGQKYKADVVTRHSLQALSRFASDPSTCLRAYAVACHLRLANEARLAALGSLCMSWRDVVQNKFSELDLMPASCLSNLLEYHRECQVAVNNTLLVPDFWVLQKDEYEPMFEPAAGRTKCRCQVHHDTFLGISLNNDDVDNVKLEFDVPYVAKSWCMEFIWDLRECVESGQFPLRRAVKDAEAVDVAITEAFKCKTCRRTVVRCLDWFFKKLDDTIDLVVGDVGAIYIFSVHALICFLQVALESKF
ncbi:hypothetical protein EIP86_005285 [Pleurotus ostreatoroseus]|nr:hypothetical protein EIP86_005285 [Pleurotus ostreatoroseus]